MKLSTTRATAHPDARITIDNTGSSAEENIKSISLKLPNGFWGSLAAASKCAYATAQAAGCTAASQIGTVDSTATIDESDARLRGKVYLTEPAPANVSTDPAGITVVVPAVVGGVDLGNVIVNARVGIRNAPLPPTSATGSLGKVEGVDTTVDSVPESITDSHGRTVSFHLNVMNIDLISDLDGPNPPLLTNPSVCSAIAVSASFTSYTTQNASASDPNPISINGCNTVKYAPSTFTMTKSSKAASSETKLSSTIAFPADSASSNAIQVKLPPAIAPNFTSFGNPADQCPAINMAVGLGLFNPNLCPAQAKVGTATIVTPLLPDPVVGNVYLINGSPIPHLAIWVSPAADPGNPKGVDMRLLGTTGLPQVDPSCDELFFTCPKQISAQFTNLPDAPVTSIQLELGSDTDRTGTSGTLSGRILLNAAATDPACQPTDDTTGLFLSSSVVGTNLRGYGVSTDTTTGCDAQDVDFTDTTTVGKIVSTASPSIAFTGTGNDCYFDAMTSSLGGCTSPLSPSSGLSTGFHRVFVQGADGKTVTRAFGYRPTPSTPDTTAPTTSITSPPASIDSSENTFNFTSNESSDFQCAINPGNSITTAFLPCSTAAGTSGSYDATGLLAGYTYTFAVRAQDAAGNVDLTPATATFTVDIPFAPAFTYNLTTTQGRAHPDLDVTITNPSHEDVKDLTFSLPDGFLGGLTGVAALCPLANADAGTCDAGSKVGTVDTEAAVDESTVRISGDVFLTESRNPGVEPASLSIKIDPTIQDVSFDPIIVNASLKVRGVVKGIDTVALSIPNSADNQYSEFTEFDLRKMVLKLRTNPSASYPLLTNPSACGAGAFNAAFTGYDGTSASDSKPVTFTGCENLGFAPGMSLQIFKSGTTNAYPGPEVNADVYATVNANPGEAGINHADLLFPKPVTIDVQKLPAAPCTQEQQAIDACPATAIIGDVIAYSPLLNEPLTGKVYLLKGTGLPWLYLRLRGRLSVDLIGKNSFVNNTQIRTVFEGLPDVPLSSFQISIRSLLTTRDYTCDTNPATEWGVAGTLTGANGKTSPVSQQLNFDCPNLNKPIYSYSFKPKKSKSTLKVSVVAQSGKTLKSVTMSMPKTVKFDKKMIKSKKLIAKRVTITGDGKKLKTKCFKFSKTTMLVINQCKRKYQKIVMSFKKGSLSVRTKKKKVKLKIKVKDSDNKKRSVSYVK